MGAAHGIWNGPIVASVPQARRNGIGPLIIKYGHTLRVFGFIGQFDIGIGAGLIDDGDHVTDRVTGVENILPIPFGVAGPCRHLPMDYLGV